MKKITGIFILASLIIFLFQPTLSKADALVIQIAYNETTGILSLGANGITLNKNLFIPISNGPEIPTSGRYEAIIFEDKGNKIFSQNFNQQNSGFSLNLPYFSIGKTLKIVDTLNNEEILQADLSKFLTCNDNGKCEFEKGENFDTCISDCASGNVKYDAPTAKLLKDGNGVINDPATGKVLLKQTAATAKTTNNNLFAYAAIIIIIIAGGIIFLILRRRNK